MRIKTAEMSIIQKMADDQSERSGEELTSGRRFGWKEPAEVVQASD